MTPPTEVASYRQQRIVLLVEYYGPAFAGAQLQHNAYTVQEAFYEAFQKLNIAFEKFCFSGRTDAGVHAKGQVVSITTDMNALNNIPDLLSAINAVLPADISVKQFAITEDFGFHPITSAQWRWYQYRIYNHPVRSVWMPPDETHIKPPLNTEKMAQAASMFLGEHDFSSFKCPRTEITNNICHVIHSQLTLEDKTLVFDIVANRFVYKMVRNLVGVLLDIGLEQRFRPEDIPQILNWGDREKAGPTAKPDGLSLMAVQYPKPWDFFHADLYVTKLNQITQESSENEKNLFRKAS